MSARELWLSVVLQAVNDVATEDYASVVYAQAVNFFIAPGAWAESRQQIADCINMHADELTRIGEAALNRRVAAEKAAGPRDRNLDRRSFRYGSIQTPVT